MEQSDKEWLNPDVAQNAEEQATVAPSMQETPQQTRTTEASDLNMPKSVSSLVVASALLHYGPAVIFIFMLFCDQFIPAAIGNFLSSILLALIMPGYGASWVLVLIARSKNKQAAAPKVLLGLYTIGLILGIIGLIMLIRGILDILETCSRMGYLL